MLLKKDLLLVLVLGLLLSNTLNAQDKGWRGYYNSAEKAVENGQYYTAAKRYEQAASLKQSNKEFSYKAGKYFLISRNYEKAIEFLAPLKAKTKSFPKVLYYYGLAEKARGNYDEALLAFSVFSNDYTGSDKIQILRFVENEMKGCEIGRSKAGFSLDSIEVVILDEQINTEFQELAPIPINDDLLYFSSNSNGNISLYKSERDAEGIWSAPITPETLPMVRQSNFCHGSFSPDYTKFYFSVCSDFEGEWREDELNCSIYFSELIGNSWTEARALSRFINLPGAINMQPYVTYEGKDELVYFVSNRSGGQGGLDIWYIKKSIRGGINSFGYPVNLGNKINSPSNEMSPFYDINQATLFYSTDGKPGLGGFDIYAAVGSMDTWLDIYTLDAPFNSSYDDLYYRPLDDQQGFFVSNRPAEPFKFSTVDNDIFHYFNKQIEPDSFLFSATILDMKNEQAIPHAEVSIFEVLGADDFVLYESLFLSSYNFEINLETGREFLVVAEKEGYVSSELLVDSEIVYDLVKVYLEEEQLTPSIDNEGPLVIDDPREIELIKDLPEDPMPELEYFPDSEPLDVEYRIQVAAVRDATNYDKSALAEYGQVVLEDIKGKELSRILIGGFTKRTAAEQQLAIMKSKSRSYSSAFIVLYTNGNRN